MENQAQANYELERSAMHEVGHRATPWMVIAGANPLDKVIHAPNFGHYGTSVATVSCLHEYEHMPEYAHQFAAANAEFIVRACNAYQGLVDALRDIAEGCSFPDDIVQRAIRDRARAALALAKEQS
jgi:hypothetical protein